jgi:hypothetical protein
MMNRSGWQGVWVDTYRDKFRTQYWPKNEIELPLKQMKLLKRIRECVGSKAGCFDVFCWKEDQFVFIESKRYRKDRIQETQKRWLQIAHLKCDIPFDHFLIVEWSVSKKSD